LPFPPAVAELLASALLGDGEAARFDGLAYHDAGHGYDAFGMHPAFVGLGIGVTSPIYRWYHRVRSYGVEHVPSHGAAILAANHSGTLPMDAAMLWLDVLLHTDPPRVARPVADHFVPALPWIGTLFARVGMVGGARGNVRALLEQGEMLMVFPEGTPAIVKPFRERYRLHPFRVGHAELALRFRAPVIPVGIVGAEEQLPAIHSSKRLVKAVGLPALPIPGVPFPLPSRYHLHYGEPLALHERYGPDAADDPRAIAEAASIVQSAVQSLLDRGLEMREGVFA
jgi:1-acyl-sn-glycerol-3-phosphate acyltransferase